jgi:hypothetical protein
MVNTVGNNSGSRGKIYVGKDKTRIEGMGQGSHGGAVIVNYATQTSDVLMPERKMYMEMPVGHGLAQQRVNFIRLLDVDNACDQWLKLNNKNNGTCHKVGNATVDGRSTVEYEATSSNGETGHVWLDKSLHFPIKWQGKDSTFQLQNIKEGAQPASLFEIPSDYQKFQMPAGMQNMPQQPH